MAYFTINFAPIGHVFSGIALPEFGRYSKWTHMDGSALAVLAAYQNNLVTSNMMTLQVVQNTTLDVKELIDLRLSRTVLGM